jgi:hypothetical protein
MKIKTQLKFSQYKDFGNLLNTIVINCHRQLGYLQYYNMLLMYKTIFLRTLRPSAPDKMVTLSFDVNGYATLLKVNEVAANFLSSPNLTYERELFRSVILDAMKQATKFTPGDKLLTS